MEKIKLEHIAPYLPYRVSIEPFYRSMSMGLGYYQSELDLEVLHGREIEDIKLILRPLSDLTRSDLFKKWSADHNIEIRYDKRVLLDIESANFIDIIGYPLQLINELFENHFDIFGLIDKGQAIDINTLNK